MIFGDLGENNEKLDMNRQVFLFLIHTIYPDGMKRFLEILGENEKLDMNKQDFLFFFISFTLVG